MRTPVLHSYRLTFPAAFAIALAWIVLGFNSQNVPWGSSQLWIVLCSMAAGAALSVAHYGSLFALRSYVAVTVIIGLLRSIAYLTNDSGGPAAVWFLVGATTLVAYLLALERT